MDRCEWMFIDDRDGVQPKECGISPAKLEIKAVNEKILVVERCYSCGKSQFMTVKSLFVSLR